MDWLGFVLTVGVSASAGYAFAWHRALPVFKGKEWLIKRLKERLEAQEKLAMQSYAAMKRCVWLAARIAFRSMGGNQTISTSDLYNCAHKRMTRVEFYTALAGLEHAGFIRLGSDRKRVWWVKAQRGRS